MAATEKKRERNEKDATSIIIKAERIFNGPLRRPLFSREIKLEQKESECVCVYIYMCVYIYIYIYIYLYIYIHTYTY